MRHIPSGAALCTTSSNFSRSLGDSTIRHSTVDEGLANEYKFVRIHLPVQASPGRQPSQPGIPESSVAP